MKTIGFRDFTTKHRMSMRDAANIAKALKIDTSNGIPLDRVNDILGFRNDKRTDKQIEDIRSAVNETSPVTDIELGIEIGNDRDEDTGWGTVEDIEEDMKLQLTDQNYIEIELDGMRESIDSLKEDIRSMKRLQNDNVKTIRELRENNTDLHKANTEIFAALTSANAEIKYSKDSEKRFCDELEKKLEDILSKQSRKISELFSAIDNVKDDILFIDRKIKTDLILKSEAEDFLQPIYDNGVEFLADFQAKGEEMRETTQAVMVAFTDTTMDSLIEQMNEQLDPDNEGGIIYEFKQVLYKTQTRYFVFMFKLLVSSRMNVV